MGSRVVVEAYGGYRGDETPRAFFMDGERVEVLRVLDQWTEEDRERHRRRCFVVKASDARTHTLCCYEEEEKWELVL